MKGSASSAVPVDSERAYRYKVTEATGCLKRAVREDAHVIDWEYYGRRHTWTVVNGEAEVIGTMTGTYLDKGAVVEGRYIPLNPAQDSPGV